MNGYLLKILEKNREHMDEWLDARIMNKLLYASFDIRFSGIKSTSVDSNLFPSGFNNLSSLQKASECLSLLYFNKKILLIIEEYTRNYNYLKNVVVLKKIIEEAGNNVVCATCNNLDIEFEELELEKIFCVNNKIVSDSGFVPEVIVLNKDMTDGPPKILMNIDQIIVPDIRSGWFNRRKSDYFRAYNYVAEIFAQKFNFDPWLISSMFSCVQNVDFKNIVGMSDIADSAATMLAKLSTKYREYNIDYKPYLFLKPNNGTQGMGISIIYDSSDIHNINKDFRKKMHTIKNNVIVREILVQEGIRTADFYNRAPAEPIAYTINSTPIDYFYRYNAKRDDTTNLNALGIEFAKMPNNVNSSYIYMLEVITKLSIIATETEYAELTEKAEEI